MLLAENTIESNLPPLGKFQMHFTGCKDKGTGATCTGLGEAAGVSLVGGTWHLVWDEKAGSAFELTVATLFLLNAAHFNCTALVLLKLEGEQLCLDLDPLTLSKTHEFHCIVKKATERHVVQERRGQSMHRISDTETEHVGQRGGRQSQRLIIIRELDG